MRRHLVVVALALVAAACAGSSGPADQLSPQDGHLSVTQHINGHLYVEGSVGYARVLQGDRTVWQGKIGDGTHVDLAPGSYSLDSYQELCIGNCGNLGPPVDKCRVAVEVTSSQTTSAVVELTPESNSCTISTS